MYSGLRCFNELAAGSRAIGHRGAQRSRDAVFLALAVFSAPVDAVASSLSFVQNAAGNYEYGLMTSLPAGFGAGEFTLELWLRPDNSKPVSTITPNTPGQLSDWSSGDPAPYSSGSWWWRGNFLLDGHNNNAFQDGTFSLQFYGGGRVRWDFGDGAIAGAGGHWAIEASPATNTASLLDGNWHQVTCVRRWSGTTSAALELWVDGALVSQTISDRRTNMPATYWNNWGGFPSGQAGWFWGAEKQAAIGVLTQYEDYKGLVDELRFWSRAKSAAELANDWAVPVTGAESGLVGWYALNEGAGTSACNAIAAGMNCITLFRTSASNWSASGAPLNGGTLNPNYVYVNFSAAPGGNGAPLTPFNTLSAGVAAANAGATIEIAPGVSSQTLSVIKAVRLINGNPPAGAVRIGAASAAPISSVKARTGFISKR